MAFSGPRRRQIPLNPQPYGNPGINRQFDLGQNPGERRLSRIFTSWLPNVNFNSCWERLSEEKREDVNRRAEVVRRHHTWNAVLASSTSEFAWEADIFHDIFGKIRDDQRLKIDKRAYNLPDTDKRGIPTIGKRIPDATIGLRSYLDREFEPDGSAIFGYDGPGSVQDHTPPHRTLSQKRMIAMIGGGECGLYADGVWGRADMVFPFAVYEAKEFKNNIFNAQGQTDHAAQTYLAMLDDLARNPEDVNSYQTPEGKKKQLFCFTSEGAEWNVHVAYDLLGKLQIERLWFGNVTSRADAAALICIVDQIHEFGVTQHRDFVIEYLEPWLAKAERRIEEQERRNKGLSWAARLDAMMQDAAERKPQNASGGIDNEGMHDGENAAQDSLATPAKRRDRKRRIVESEDLENGTTIVAPRKRKRPTTEPIGKTQLPNNQVLKKSTKPLVATEALRRSNRNKGKQRVE